MRDGLQKLLIALLLAFPVLPISHAQQENPDADSDGSSERTEQRDDSFRRQMELEDARSRDKTYVDNTYSQKSKQEKIDKLPEESRENIRDQLVDIIMENGEWEPSDALGEYPYIPSESAQTDRELMEQEQAAWDEQIEKYHEREAQAFGAYRGEVPGPGNPGGQEGGQQGDGNQQGQPGSEQGGGRNGGGGEGAEADSAGTYQPYQPGASGAEDEISTAGVSESALDFLKGGQGRQPAQGAGQPAGPNTQVSQEIGKPMPPDADGQMAQQSAEEAAAEQASETVTNAEPDTLGIIAIEDLDKLEGTEIPAKPDGP